jgi:2-methylaconitate cis-trans-isomerase PrpF
MIEKRIRACFMRGGTSKAVMFRREDLPAERENWATIFLGIMGSPDAYGRQLDGMGGGVSSLSKVCVVGPPTRPDADVDFTFAQILIGEAAVDYNGTCGNMSSAIGPFALAEGLVKSQPDGDAVVRIHNTNTGKIVISRFPVQDGHLAVAGNLEIDGVSGQGAAIRLEFLDPGGSRTGKLLPTGVACDTLMVDGLGPVEASCIDASNPCVFIEAAVLGKRANETPDELGSDPAFLDKIEKIRQSASVAMGFASGTREAAKIGSIPRIAIVARSQRAVTLSGRELLPSDADISIRMISMGQPHRAVPVTGAVCLAVAARIPGSIPHAYAPAGCGPVRIAQPSGITVVDAKITPAPQKSGGIDVEYGAVYRTARRLFDGYAYYRG